MPKARSLEMTIGFTLLELSLAFVRDLVGGGGGVSLVALLASWAFIVLILVDHDAVEEASSKVMVMIKVFMAVSSQLHSGRSRT